MLARRLFGILAAIAATMAGFAMPATVSADHEGWQRNDAPISAQAYQPVAGRSPATVAYLWGGPVGGGVNTGRWVTAYVAFSSSAPWSIGWQCGTTRYNRTVGTVTQQHLVGPWFSPGTTSNAPGLGLEPLRVPRSACQLTIESSGTVSVQHGVVRWYYAPGHNEDYPGPGEDGGAGGGGGTGDPPTGGEPTPSPPPPTPTPTPADPPTPSPSPSPDPTPLETCPPGQTPLPSPGPEDCNVPGEPATPGPDTCGLFGDQPCDPEPTPCFQPLPSGEVGPPAPTPCPTASPGPTPEPANCTWNLVDADTWALAGVTTCVADQLQGIPAQDVSYRLKSLRSDLVGHGGGTGEWRDFTIPAVLYAGAAADVGQLSVNNTTGSFPEYNAWCDSALWACRATNDVTTFAGGTLDVTMTGCEGKWASFACTAFDHLHQFVLYVDLPQGTGTGPDGGGEPSPSPTEGGSPSPQPQPTQPANGQPGVPAPIDPGECQPAPLSGDCKPGAPYTPGAVCTNPWPSLNPLDYLGYLGCLLGNVITAIANAVAWVINAIIDLILPGAGLSESWAGFMAFLEGKVPFGWMSQASDALGAALGAAAITADPQFTLAGQTITVPLYSLGGELAPYRLLILAGPALGIILAMLHAIMGALGVSRGPAQPGAGA